MVIRRGPRWIYNKILSNITKCLLAIATAGPMPQHVAFTMDGNRRYARRNGWEVNEGHLAGYDALERVLEMCQDLKIQCVSVYAFSFGNSKRPPEEINCFMPFLKDHLLKLFCSKRNRIFGKVRLNVIGRVELFPKSIQRAVKKAEKMTRRNKGMIFNLYMPYTSQDEMTTAITDCVKHGLKRDIGPDSYFIEDELNKHLVRGSPPLDILVRTSGVKRLSDFMLWQCCENTQIHFIKKYWPEFGLWDLLRIILNYQRKIYSSRITV